MIAIDLYFFMNAAYDLTLLCMAGIVAKKKLYFLRVLLAALVGSAWSTVALMALLSFSLSQQLIFVEKFVTYGICPYLMCRIAYKTHSLAQSIEALLYFYGMGALISGFMILLKWAGIHIPSWILMPICGGLSAGLWLYLTQKEEKSHLLYDITIVFRGKQIYIKGLYDSGNTLMTAKKEPVHVMAPSAWKLLVGEDSWQENGFFIPYQTISQTSVMPGIYLDQMCIKLKEGVEQLILEHAAVALGSMEIDTSTGCQILLNRDTFDQRK